MKLTINEAAFDTLRLIKKINDTKTDGFLLELTPFEIKLLALGHEYIYPLIQAKNIKKFIATTRSGEVRNFEFDPDPDTKQFKCYETPRGEAILLGPTKTTPQGTDTLWFHVIADKGCSYWGDVNNKMELEAHQQIYLSKKNLDSPEKKVIKAYCDIFPNLNYSVSKDENCLRDIIQNENFNLFLLLAYNKLVNPSIFITSGAVLSNKSKLVDFVIEYPIKNGLLKKWLEEFLNETSSLGKLLRTPRLFRSTDENRGNYKKIIDAYRQFYPEELFSQALTRAKAGNPLLTEEFPQPPTEETTSSLTLPELITSDFIVPSAPPLNELTLEMDRYLQLEEIEAALHENEVPEAIEEEIPLNIKIEDTKLYPEIARVARELKNKTTDEYIKLACPPLNYREIGIRLHELAMKSAARTIEKKEESTPTEALVDANTVDEIVDNVNKPNSVATGMMTKLVIEEEKPSETQTSALNYSLLDDNTEVVKFNQKNTAPTLDDIFKMEQLKKLDNIHVPTNLSLFNQATKNETPAENEQQPSGKRMPRIMERS